MADNQAGPLAKKDEVLAGAAVSAAVAAVVYGLRKAQAENGRLRRGSSLVIAALESASDSILPLAEGAAEEAGRWVAKNSPALVRERLLPRFIDAFEAAA